MKWKVLSDLQYYPKIIRERLCNITVNLSQESRIRAEGLTKGVPKTKRRGRRVMALLHKIDFYFRALCNGRTSPRSYSSIYLAAGAHTSGEEF